MSLHAPIPKAVVAQASEWLMLHWGGDLSAAQREAFDRWHNADLEHARAWQRLQQLQHTLGSVPQDHARATFRDQPDAQRRNMLKLLGLMLTVGGSGYLLQSSQTLRTTLADVRTSVGEIRRETLDDGTLLTLDTDSAVDILFTDKQRRIRLLSGKILLDTGHDPAFQQRPLIVETAMGEIQALGTRFCVTDLPDRTRVELFQGALEIRAQAAPAVRLEAGQQLWFSRSHVGAITAADANDSVWSEGRLIAERQPLGEFLTQLSRYRSGYLRCDKAAQDLLLTGVFPLANTDLILDSLTRSLPVEIHRTTRFWVTVKHRG